MTGLVAVGGVLTNPAPASAAALDAPASATALAGRRAVKVTWTAPASGTVGRYRATAGTQTCDLIGPSFPGTLTCTVGNLDPNVTYTATVIACPSTDVNVTTDCSGPRSAGSVKTGPPATPNAPTVTYTGVNQNSMHLSWVPADEGAGIAYYRVTSSPAFNTETGTCTALQVPVGTSCDVANLTPNTSYSFRLTAVGVNNATGTTGSSALGAASTPKYSGVPTKPDTPEVVRVSNSAARVSWTKPSGGAAVGGFLVEKTTGGQTTVACTEGASATSCDVTGLDPAAAYTFTVKANGEGVASAGGSSAASDASSAITLGKPNRPDAPTVELGATAGKVRVYWSAPEAGGGTVTGYLVTPTPGGTDPYPCEVGPSVRSCDFSGLATDGTPYTFTVVAKGEAGAVNSDASATSDPIVSQLPDTPNTPTAALVANTTGAVTLTWAAKGTGGPVIFYTVTVLGDGQTGTPSDGCGFNLAAPTCTITGLNPAATYTFKVKAYGDLGPVESAASTPIVPNKPGAATAVAVTLDDPGAGVVSVAWDAPDAGTGGAVASYTVTATPSAGSPVVGCSAVSSATRICTFASTTALDPTKSYTIKVRATNAVGDTDTTAVITAPAKPSAPQTPAAALVANTASSVAVSWTAPDQGTATNYVVTVAPVDGSTPPTGCSSAGTSCTVTGLNAAKSYTFTVRAENLLGGSDASPTAAITPDKPGAPANVTVTVPAADQATVTWDQPAGGGPVATYTVTAIASDNSETVGCNAVSSVTRTCTFSGGTALSGGQTYTFRVTATNVVNGTSTTTTDAISPAAPGAPTGVAAALGDEPGKITVTWTAPAGGAVTTYTVTPASASSGSPIVPGNCTRTAAQSRECVFTGLTPTATYTFTVRAANDVDGTNASPTVGLIPDRPGLPVNVQAVRGNAVGKATVTWDAPGAGGALLKYEVTPASTDNAAFIPAVCTVTIASGNPLSCTWTDLTASKPYTFSVSAINAAGHQETVSTPALIPNKPDKPANVVVTVPTPGSARVVWDSPTGAPVTGGWTVSASSTTGGAAAVTDCTVTQNAARDCTLTGLTQAANYTVTVTAHNVAGDTVSDTVGPIVADNPNAPGIPTGEVLSGTQVRLTWTEPSAGGGPVAKYAVKAYTVGAPTTPISSTPCTDVTLLTCDFDGLSTTETYTFRVIALGPGGGSTTGGRSTPFTTALPAKPAAPTVALEGNAVRVTWTEPSGGPVVSYSVISAPDVSAPARCTNVRVLSCLFDRLHSGTPYTFKVVANGTAGRPVESDASSQITIPVVIAAPGAPGEPTAMASDPDRAFVSWTAPVVGGPVTKYTVNAYASGAPGVALTSQTCTEVTNLGCMFGGLTDTGTYTFRVTAIGPGGDTQSDPSFDVTTAAPGKPAVPTVQLAGPRSVKVSWVFPQGPGPISSFTVVSTPDLSAPARCTNTQATECVFDRLASGTSYTFKVRANGFFDRFTDSDASADIIAGPPGTMAAPTVAPVGPTSVNVYWAAPATGGSVTGYQVLSSTGNLGCAATAGPNATSCLVSGLTPGTSYTFTVKAQGAAGGGDSAVSAASAAIVAGAPAAPTDVEVAAGDRQIAVSWTGPTVTTGIVRYRATTTPGGLYCEVTGNTTTECVISGVQNLTSYTVTVTAVSANGSSPASAPSVRVRPTAGRPGAPTAVQAIGGNTTALVTWTAPTAIGNGIARYIATAVDSTGTQKVCSAPNTAVTCTIEGLTNGTPYSVSVAAVGPAASGISLPGTAVTVTPRLVVAPGVPTNVLVTMGVRSLTVSWSAGSAGDGLAGFTVTATPPTGTPLTCAVPATETSCTFTDVPLGPYAATVVARGTGTGVVSAASTPYWGTSLFAAGPTLPTLLTSVPASSGTLTGLASSASAGGSITITGGGFAPWTGLSVYVYAPRVKLATIVADANGAFSIPVGIPPTTATGSKTIVVAGLTTTGGSTIRTLTGTFTLQSAL